MQYTEGTATFTFESNTVIGSGTLWTTNVSIGDLIKVLAAEKEYQVAAILSDTEIRLTQLFEEGTETDASYQITRDFTPIYGFTEINPGDKDWPVHLTEGFIRKVDDELATLTGPFPAVFKSGVNMPLLPAECRGTVVYVTSDGKIRLPEVSELTNAFIIFYVRGAYIVLIDPGDNDRIVYDGIALDDGHSLSSDGTAGSMVMLHKDSADGWSGICRSGTWSDGGTATTTSTTSTTTTSSSTSTTTSTTSTTTTSTITTTCSSTSSTLSTTSSTLSTTSTTTTTTTSSSSTTTTLP